MIPFSSQKLLCISWEKNFCVGNFGSWTEILIESERNVGEEKKQVLDKK